MVRPKIFMRKSVVFALVVLLSLSCFSAAASGSAYSIGFSTSQVQILSPSASGLEYDGELTIEGRSGLGRVWFCLRGPGGEVVTYPAEVRDGRFSLTMQLRFGQGTYTVWAGDNSTRFDGSIRFLVVNKTREDTRYVTPSAFVDSNHPEVMALAASLAPGSMSDREKLKSIHGWVTRNIAYDYEAYLEGRNVLIPASQTIASGKGICRDYSFVVAALARAAGLKARVVYGEAGGSSSWAPQNHAWNEVYVGGNWVPVDATWDSGFIKNGSFVGSPGTRYLAPEAAMFAMTHNPTTRTLH